MDPMILWKWTAIAAASLGLATASQAHTVQEVPVPGYSFAGVEMGPDLWTVTLVSDDPDDEQFVTASGPWTGTGTDTLVWLMTDGTAGSGGTYKDRLRACAEVAALACKPNKVCWAIYSESGGPPNGPPSTTSCLMICKDGNNPCPAPPSQTPPGKTTPVPGDG